jgi:hypothetical protein
MAVNKKWLDKFAKNISKWISKKKNKEFSILYLSALYYVLAISVMAVLIFYLNDLVPTGILFMSLLASSLIIVLLSLYKKLPVNGINSLTLFMALCCIFMICLVFVFSNMTPPKGFNNESRDLTFDVYIVNNVITDEQVTDYFKQSNAIWNKYNISIKANKVYFKNINLTKEEITYLFHKGNNAEECANYTPIINKITDNNQNLKVIFLGNMKSNNSGRGSICNGTFALVSPERFVIDYTGWDLAHEFGHILGLDDISYKGRVAKNLMNDEHKRLLFRSGYLSQYQIDKVKEKSKYRSNLPMDILT